MELLLQDSISYILDTSRVDNKLHAYILCIVKNPDKTLPRICNRYDLSETYTSLIAASRDALNIAKRLACNEISAVQPEVKKRVGEYELFASAIFQIESKKWEPLLKIKSLRAKNKGEIQDLLLEQTPLQRNACSTVMRATEFALEYGGKLIRGQVPGLKV
jgi:hypothetical protein